VCVSLRPKVISATHTDSAVVFKFYVRALKDNPKLERRAKLLVNNYVLPTSL